MSSHTAAHLSNLAAAVGYVIDRATSQVLRERMKALVMQVFVMVELRNGSDWSLGIINLCWVYVFKYVSRNPL